MNPPVCKRLAASSATESWQQLDVFARVGRKEDGRPVVVVGCVRNGQWVPLTFFDRNAHNWWDRLSYVPSRWLPQVDEQRPLLKSKEKSASMAFYDSRLMSEVPEWRKKLASCPDAAVSDKRLSLKSCTASGDRLSRLPPRRKLLRKQVYQHYHDLYWQFKSCEEAVKKMQLERSLQKLDEEAQRLIESIETPTDEEQQKILSLLNCLLDLDADEFLSNVFLGQEEALLAASGLVLSEQDGPQSDSSSDGTLRCGETEDFEPEVEFAAILNKRESQEGPNGEETQEETSESVSLEGNALERY